MRLAIWNHTKQQKGFGYVEFEKEGGAEMAVKKTGMRVGSRPVIIDYDTAEGPKKSYKKQDGQHYEKLTTTKKQVAREKRHGGKK